MATYKVTVTREVHQTLDIKIQADNETDALLIAYNSAGNLDFTGREKDAEYLVSDPVCLAE